MSEPNQLSRESLSALMDGEGTVFEGKRVPARLAEDQALRSAWARYQLTSALLHQQPVGSVEKSLAFADRVQRAIREQQETVAPASTKARRWPRWAGQLAVAASCAAVAVGVTTWQMSGDNNTQLHVAEAVNTARHAVPQQQTVVANVAAPKLMETPLLSPVSPQADRERLQWLEARPDVSPVNFVVPKAPAE